MILGTRKAGAIHFHRVLPTAPEGGDTQSLEGRTAVLHLLPLSISELEMESIRFGSSRVYCFTGFLPANHSRSFRPVQTYSHYRQTCLERDVRRLVQLRDANFIRPMPGGERYRQE